MSAVGPIFSLRDLNRQPATVLKAARKYGSVEIRTRQGEVFTLSREASKEARSPQDYVARFDQLWKKQQELGLIPPAAEEHDRINRIIAGEE